MEQQIRFCTTPDGTRIAYSTMGQGSPLVYASGWVSHLELVMGDVHKIISYYQAVPLIGVK